MKAVLFISHGSRYPETKEEVSSFVNVLKQQSQIEIFEYAFLEIAHPNIPEGIEICIEKGATDIVILLNFLNTGRHVNCDIPSIVEAAQTKHPAVSFHITKPIGQHGEIARLFLDLVENNGPIG